MQGQLQSAAGSRGIVFGRGFAVLAAGWLVTQHQFGVFAGPWSDEANLPGNACWLLVLYCQLHLGLDWLSCSRAQRRLHPELLLQMLCVALLETSVYLFDLAREPLLGQALHFAQPLLVLFGFAALHRRAAQRA